MEKLRIKYEKKGKMSALLGIIEIYEDTEEPMSARIAAAKVLGESRHPKAIDALATNVRGAENLDLDMMLTSIDILAQQPSAETARAFTGALSAVDAKMALMRTKLVEGLDKIDSEDHVQSLIDLYQNSREYQLSVEQLLTNALGKMGDEKVIPVLMNIADDPGVAIETRSMAMEILAKKKSPEVVGLFSRMLGDPTSNLRMREFALRAMGDVKEERLILALLETYQLGREEYYSLMNTLLEALGDFDAPAIKPTLVEMAISDEVPTAFRKRALQNLANFKDPTVLDRIIPLLENSENYFLHDDIEALAVALLPDGEGQERLNRAALKAARKWERKK
ncbi:HEAT repeat domain-containing protein [Candidatus Neomarinimicrobiota bacterium]